MQSLARVAAVLCAALPLLSQAGPLNVAVAANVQYAFDDLATAFKQESGIELKPVYGSSGKFAAQIASGAPFHVFLSADMDYPEKLAKDGLTLGAPKPYALGSLVVWTMRDLPVDNWRTLVKDAAIAKVAVANPQLAPYGREAVKALDYYKLKDAVQPKLVFGESVSQTNQFISTGAVDLGFTAKSVVVSQELRSKGRWVEVPREAYEPIAQGAVLLKYAQDHDAADAKRFYDFLYAGKARAIFEKNGYRLP